jgi:hypothetical protein
VSARLSTEIFAVKLGCMILGRARGIVCGMRVCLSRFPAKRWIIDPRLQKLNRCAQRTAITFNILDRFHNQAPSNAAVYSVRRTDVGPLEIERPKRHW